MALNPRVSALIKLLADGAFHSGTQLGQALGVSRAMVGRYMDELQALDLELFAVKGKGYRLAKPLELLEEGQIRSMLTEEARAHLKQLHIGDSVDSTNTLISSLSSAGAGSGSICMAEHQSAGKGRRGRQWVSPYADNLYLSLLWQFEGGASAVGPLSLVVAIELAEMLSAMGVVGVGIKWPNDLQIEGKKLGGILLELTGEASGPCQVVVGVGLNIGMDETRSEEIGQPWCSLNGCGYRLSRNRLAAGVINALLPALADYSETGFGAYLQRWDSFDLLKGKAVTLSTPNNRIEGVVEGIDGSGSLILHSAHGRAAYASGEISVRLQDGLSSAAV